VVVGDAALSNSAKLEIVWPIKRGKIVDFTAMEALWHHTFYDALRVAPEEHPCLLIVAPLTPPEHVKQLGQVWMNSKKNEYKSDYRNSFVWDVN